MLIENVLELIAPKNPIPLIFDSPHSGTHYPADFNYSCAFQTLEKAEDQYVDDLFAAAPDYNAPLLRALFPRSYLDVNRAHNDIDPELFDGDWPYDDMPIDPTNRSYAGIGLIRRLISPNEPVYAELLSPKEIKSRIETYYRPYHDVLENIIDGAHKNYGQVWHVNCHSMPSKTLGASLKNSALGRVNPYIQPDFVLGDRDGTSCDLDFTHSIRDHLKSKGYIVAINNPYKGVELVERYSTPSIGRHSLQIEISKALYLNEETHQKSKNYEKLKADITGLIAYCADYTQSNLIPMAAD